MPTGSSAYSISDRMTAQLAVDALNCAVIRRRLDGHDAAGCILRDDRAASSGPARWAMR